MAYTHTLTQSDSNTYAVGVAFSDRTLQQNWEYSVSPRQGRPFLIRSIGSVILGVWSVCEGLLEEFVCVWVVWVGGSGGGRAGGGSFLHQLYREGARLSHTFCLTPNRSACCTHLQCSSRHMPAALTGYHALPTAAERALNLMVSKYSRNQADNETRYPLPSMPCSNSSQGLLLLTQEMHYWETFSLTLSLPLILLFLHGPRSASRQGEMPTSPQSPGRVPSPFMQMLHH